MDAWSQRDMEKKMTSLSQQHFFHVPAHVDPNQSLMKNTLIQFKPVASRKFIFVLQGCCPWPFQFQLKVHTWGKHWNCHCSHHTSVSFSCLVYLQMKVCSYLYRFFFCKDSKFTGCKHTVNFDCFRFLCHFIAPWSMVLLIFIVPVHRDFLAFSLCPALSKRDRCFLLPSEVANICHQANVCNQRS